MSKWLVPIDFKSLYHHRMVSQPGHYFELSYRIETNRKMSKPIIKLLITDTNAFESVIKKEMKRMVEQKRRAIESLKDTFEKGDKKPITISLHRYKGKGVEVRLRVDKRYKQVDDVLKWIDAQEKPLI